MCDFLPKGLKAAGAEAKRSSHFDRPFSYTYSRKPGEKSGGKGYEADFSFKGQASPTGLRGDILFRSYLIQTGEQQGFYREIFDIFQFHLKERILTHSYLYYVSSEDFEKNFNNSHFMPYSKPELFELVRRAAPKSYTKVAWDKSFWKCHPITRLKFYMKDLQTLFSKLLSG